MLVALARYLFITARRFLRLPPRPDGQSAPKSPRESASHRAARCTRTNRTAPWTYGRFAPASCYVEWTGIDASPDTDSSGSSYPARLGMGRGRCPSRGLVAA